MNIARCRFCGKKIPKWLYSNALFCGDNCRTRYSDVKNRPEANKTACKLVEGVVETKGVIDNEEEKL